MDPTVQRLLQDKLYDKRKQGALDVERVLREASLNKEQEKVAKIVHQLCHDFAYAVHQPYARNGGLIGLAAAAIALGTDEVARYLPEIVPPVLACFNDQDARVRYYACESLYNISKVAKGEILLFFNDVFDALCKLAGDAELSVKNGAELLDRLIKDIVSESAATYVSILQAPEEVAVAPEFAANSTEPSLDMPTAFSLARFIPLLKERIYVLNPFTRTFLVSWVTLLDTIPDLELVFYLPAFLGGLFQFLSDPNRDVHVATQGALERFLTEIKKIARIKRAIAESRKTRRHCRTKDSLSSDTASTHTGQSTANDKQDGSSPEEDSVGSTESSALNSDGDWIPGQDIQVDHPAILEILVAFLDSSSAEEIQLTALRWIDSFFEICPEDILPFLPRLLAQVLPAMANQVEQVRQAANRVNTSLMGYIVSLSDDTTPTDVRPGPPTRTSTIAVKETDVRGRRPSTPTARLPVPPEIEGGESRTEETQATVPKPSPTPSPSKPKVDLDYAAAVNALILQFLNEHEATRVAALAWLIMLHKKAPRKVLVMNDGTFPALLKTLSDSSEAVVTRDLQLLSQISRNSEDSYFTSFMVNLLQLFCTDRKLLEMRGNLVIRQLCVGLSPERIYRTLADCLEKDEDVEFASIMVQNLNNNLITAPELADMRKRLRNLETRDGQTFFVALFRSWCHNAVATFSLCLLAQAYEQAYNLLQIFAELEMTINMLIQIDKLVQLLESPVFTYLRLQLLEPEKYPHLYKCLYGLLMLLPQSSAFAALKNRLNSVSAIGYLHIAPRAYATFSHPNPSISLYFSDLPGRNPNANPSPSRSPAPSSTFDRPNRLKAREESIIKWADLLDKFKAVQEKARRGQRMLQNRLLEDGDARHGANPSTTQQDGIGSAGTGEIAGRKDSKTLLADLPRQQPLRPLSAGSVGQRAAQPPSGQGPGQAPGMGHKPKSSLGNLGRLAGVGVGGPMRKMKR